MEESMLDTMVMWLINFLMIFGGIWYIKDGYYYGFIKKKFLKNRFLRGDEEDYYYDKKAKTTGSFYMLLGLVSIIISISILYNHYF
jgi:hypothetical protein